MRYLLVLSVCLAACGTVQEKPGDNNGNPNNSGTSGVRDPNGTSLFGSLALLDNFADGDPGGVPSTSFGVWQDYHGGANSDGTASLVFNAAGVTDNAANYSYTTDSGAWTYSNFGLLRTEAPIDAATLDITGVRFWAKGTGVGTFKFLISNTNMGGSNNYGTYRFDLGALPAQWTLYEVLFADCGWDLSNGGAQNYTLTQALQSFTGPRFETNTPGATGSVQIDDLALGYSGTQGAGVWSNPNVQNPNNQDPNNQDPNASIFTQLTVMDDFATSDAGGVSPNGFGTWNRALGGPNNDGAQSLDLAAQGHTDNGAYFTYTTDSGAWAYNNFYLTGTAFDAQAAGYTGLSFWIKGTGSADVKVLLSNTHQGGSNNYNTYKVNLGTLPTDWTKVELAFTQFTWDLTNGGTQDYTREQALQALTGITFEVNQGGGVSGTVSLDDLALGK
jgi:hypothetical protein